MHEENKTNDNSDVKDTNTVANLPIKHKEYDPNEYTSDKITIKNNINSIESIKFYNGYESKLSNDFDSKIS